MQSSEYFDGVAASMESAFGDVTLTSDDQSHNEPHKSHRPDAIQQVVSVLHLSDTIKTWFDGSTSLNKGCEVFNQTSE